MGVDYLSSPWCGLPKEPGTNALSHRLIAVQAAAVALANRYLAHAEGVRNVVTAFPDELQGEIGQEILAARRDHPQVNLPNFHCWYPREAKTSQA